MEIKETAYIYRLSAGEKLAWHGRFHSHGENEFEIHFFSEGSGIFFSNKASHPISGGSLFLTSPREFHSILPDKVTSPLTYYAVLFSLSQAENSLYQLLIHPEAKRRHSARESEIPVLRFILEDILKLSKSPSFHMKKSAALLLESCLYRWFGKSAAGSHGKKSRAAQSAAARQHVADALKYMERNVCESRSIAQVASSCGISEEHLIRIFKAEMQMTPYQYFTRLKIQMASLALLSSSCPVSKVAADFSFENQFHFSRVFKKCTGMAPSLYRSAYT